MTWWRKLVPFAALERREVRLADGAIQFLRDIDGKPAVFCPYHSDEHASAFVVRSQNGTPGIHCATCGQTFWPSAPPSYDLDDFENAVREAHTRGAGSGPFRDVDIKIVDGWATPTIFEQGLAFIKSAKGTGKTTGLWNLLRGKRTVLLIGHRRLLNRNLSERLELNSYLDKDGSDFEHLPWRGKNDSRLRRFAVSLESLRLVPPNKEYDLIILDESEQVLRHFLSETIEKTGHGSRDRVFKQFGELVRRAKAVVALDADLGWISFRTLSKMRAELEGPAASRLIWLNEAKPGEGKEIQLYDSKNALVGVLMQALRDGKKCFVASTSKNQIDRRASAIERSYSSLRVLKVTGETSGQEEAERFIAAPAMGTADYDVALASPSLGTGVDIFIPLGSTIFPVSISYMAVFGCLLVTSARAARPCQ